MTEKRPSCRPVHSNGNIIPETWGSQKPWGNQRPGQNASRALPALANRYILPAAPGSAVKKPTRWLAPATT